MTLVFGTQPTHSPPTSAQWRDRRRAGAYFVLYPTSRVVTLVFVWPARMPAWFLLGFWFLYQLIEANFGLFRRGNGRGVAMASAEVLARGDA
jgi:hypothetical protein